MNKLILFVLISVNILQLISYQKMYFFLLDTTTFQTTTNDEESGLSTTSTTTTESPWPPELNCTVVIPVCMTITTFTDDSGSFSTTEDGYDSTTGQGTDDFDLTINGTDTADENATLRETCLRYLVLSFFVKVLKLIIYAT